MRKEEGRRQKAEGRVRIRGTDLGCIFGKVFVDIHCPEWTPQPHIGVWDAQVAKVKFRNRTRY